MNSSTTRLILAVVISLAILVVWERFFSPQPDVTPPPASKSPAVSKSSASKSPASQPSAGGQPDSRGASSQPAAAAVSPGEGPLSTSVEGGQVTLDWKAAKARLTFTDRGAALRKAVLLDPRFKEAREGKFEQVDLVQTAAGKGPWPLEMTFVDSDFRLPANARFELRSRSDKHVRYEWRSKKVQVFKHYSLDPVRPMLWVTLSVGNLTDRALRHRLQVRLFGREGENGAEAGITNPYPRRPTALCRVNGELVRRSAKSVVGQQSTGCAPGGCGVGSGEYAQIGEVLWVASDDRYFLSALVPRDKDLGQLRCGLGLLESDRDVVQASLLYPEGTLSPGGWVKRRFAVYLGAKDLAQLDSVKGPKDVEGRLGETIEFGWFDFLSRPLLMLLKVLHGVSGNWGVAIILLTLLIKLVTAYWSNKSMRSMRQMQRLKPKMDVLRAKFKDDKQRMNQELMALYKLHKVSPLGGCVPMLIQMPIWFALYSTLGNAQELYRSGFFGWITDLTAADPYYVLPLFVGGAMFGQQAISPQPMEGAQAKMMKYFMPAMFTVFMMWLPSGLNVYILVNTVLTMIHQWYINKSDPIEPTPSKAAVPSSAVAPKASAPPTRRAPVAEGRRGGTPPRGVQTGAPRSGKGKAGKRRRRKKTQGG